MTEKPFNPTVMKGQGGNCPRPQVLTVQQLKPGGTGHAHYTTTSPSLNSRPSYGPGANKPTTEWGHYEYLSILRGLHIDDNYIALYT